MNYVLDASVYVAQLSPKEKHHDRAIELWEIDPEQFHAPEIFPLEVVAALSRLQWEADAIAHHQSITMDAKFALYPVDKVPLDEAMVFAKDGRIRAADAIYMALASRLDATFITLDFKLQKHLSTAQNSALREFKILS